MFKPSVRPRGINAASVRSSQGPKSRAPRQEVLSSAKINFDGGPDLMDCTIRDISTGGARISVPKPAETPNSFLMISTNDSFVARCQVAWRRGHELGVRFVRKGAIYQEDDFRKDQARAWAANKAAQEQGNAETTNAFKAGVQADAKAQQFKVLKLDPTLDYTPEQLKSRFRTLAMRAHPDHGGTVAEFQALTKAYNALVATSA